MTQEQKEKISSGTNWIPKVLTPALLITIGIMLYNGGGVIKDIDSRTFPDTETRAKHIEHVNKAPNDVDVYKKFLDLKQMKAIDSLDKLNAIKSRASRDKRDSLEAVTQWQMKQAIEKINEKLNIE